MDTQHDILICPVCKELLSPRERSLACPAGHSFDLAKSGYVNLHLSQSNRAHGDDKGMVKARQAFLDQGYYQPLADRLCALAQEYTTTSRPVVVDAGCGECWYTAQVHAALTKTTQSLTVGVDLSKHALAAGAKRCPELVLAVSSVSRLPVKAACCDLLLSLFAPIHEVEFARILKQEGFLLRVTPLPSHLWELKQAVYSTPRPNPPEPPGLPGFFPVHSEELRGSIRLSSTQDILHLFSMTPYSYKTGKQDAQKLLQYNSLTVQTAFQISLYRKEEGQ